MVVEEEEEEEGDRERPTLQLSGCEGFVWEREDKGRGEGGVEMDSDEELENSEEEVYYAHNVCVH